MTNHVHLIVGTHGNNLEHILRDHKKHTSLALVEAIKTNLSESRREWIMEQFKNAADLNGHNTRHQVWQQHNQPIELSSEKMMFQYLDYLHNNPVKAGFVLCPEHWLYSSALDYFGKTGLLDCLIPIDVAIRG